MTFRIRIFFAAFITTALSLAVSTMLVSMELRRSYRADVEQTLMKQARLAAELLSNRATVPDPEIEAQQLGTRIDARVTFIDANGLVLGDSDVTRERLSGVENHNDRPEIVAARNSGAGAATRASSTRATVPISSRPYSNVGREKSPRA